MESLRRMGLGIGLVMALIMLFALPFTGAKAGPILQGPPTPVSPTEPPGSGEDNCEASYPDICIQPFPPDLDCGDIPYQDFHVLPPDPHGFDRDLDGLGCES